MLNKFRKLKVSIVAIALMASFAATSNAQQDFSFVTPDGQTVALSGLRGKVAVFVFGGVQDPQCRDEFKALESLAERYQGKNVAIYWVSVDPASAVNNDRLKSPCGPVSSVIVLRDQNQAAFKRYSGKVPQLPTIVVLNQQGELHGQPRGGFNPNSDFINDMAQIIDSLLGQK